MKGAKQADSERPGLQIPLRVVSNIRVINLITDIIKTGIIIP